MRFDPPITITAAEAWPLRLPLHAPMRLASETVAVAETLLIRLVDFAGREGWGEASAAPTMTGEVLPGMAEVAARFLLPALRAAPIPDADAADRRLVRAVRGNPGARAAVEIALLDLAARRAGLPLAALLGGARCDAVPAIAMIGGATESVVVDAARDAAARGHRHLKVKVGLEADPRRDAAMLRALRAALPGAHLAADANMAWSVEAALAFLAALPAGTLDYLEQPVADDDIAGMARIAAATSVPLCIDEGLHGPRDIAAHAAARAAGGVGLKAIKLGGLRAALAADALARGLGLRTTLACKIAEGSVGAAATTHLAAVVPDVGWGLSVTHAMLAEDVTDAPVRVQAGAVCLPPGPGIGVVPDMRRLARFRAG